MNRILQLTILLCATSVFAQPFTHSELGWRRRAAVDVLNTATLTTWLKADASVYSDFGVTPAQDGEHAQFWGDQSGNGKHATNAIPGDPGIGPIYLTNQLNGLPILRFSLTNELFVGLTSTTNPSAYSPDAAYIAVLRYTRPSNSVTFQTFEAEIGKSPDEAAYIAAVTNTYSGGLLTTNRFHVIAWVLNGSNSLIRIDGSTVFSGSVPETSTYYLQIGRGSVQVGAQDIAEIMRDGSDISISAIQAREAYLSNKWGL